MTRSQISLRWTMQVCLEDCGRDVDIGTIRQIGVANAVCGAGRALPNIREGPVIREVAQNPRRP